jgi:hypothetical protein
LQHPDVPDAQQRIHQDRAVISTDAGNLSGDGYGSIISDYNKMTDYFNEPSFFKDSFMRSSL